MNSSVAEKLEGIAETLEQLRRAVKNHNERVDGLQKEREELQRENWSSRKELMTLHHADEDFTSLENANEALRNAHKQLHQRLQVLLADLKALRSEYRP